MADDSTISGIQTVAAEIRPYIDEAMQLLMTERANHPDARGVIEGMNNILIAIDGANLAAVPYGVAIGLDQTLHRLKDELDKLPVPNTSLKYGRHATLDQFVSIFDQPVGEMSVQSFPWLSFAYLIKARADKVDAALNGIFAAKNNAEVLLSDIQKFKSLAAVDLNAGVQEKYSENFSNLAGC